MTANEQSDDPRRDRVAIALDVRCESPHPAGNRRYVTLNLGRGGVFLKTLFPLPTGTELDCTIRLPDDQPPVEAKAEVAWVRDRKAAKIGKPTGMGIRFVDLPPGDVERLHAFVADHAEHDEPIAEPEPPEENGDGT